MTEIITTTNLTKYYGKSRGIIDLNLSVGEGEIFGFIGPNGAGKSTTMRVLLGLVAPTSGSACIFGKEVGKKQKEILSQIGYLPSEAMFYNGMKVSEILELSSKLYRKDCVQERKRLCDQFSLDQSRKVEELSLGNRKKVAIVCAFQHKPDLLVLDEPTSGLDPLMQKEFFELLQERNREGAGILLSSHVLSEVQQYCRRAAILREGRLVACDSVEHLAGKNCRKIEIKGTNEPPRLEGVRKVVSGDKQVSFLYHGQMQKLIAELSQMPVEDLRVTEPELEEIFLHYYTEGGEKA